jgi:hypothetical protein
MELGWRCEPIYETTPLGAVQEDLGCTQKAARVRANGRVSEDRKPYHTMPRGGH